MKEFPINRSFLNQSSEVKVAFSKKSFLGNRFSHTCIYTNGGKGKEKGRERALIHAWCVERCE